MNDISGEIRSVSHACESTDESTLVNACCGQLVGAEAGASQPYPIKLFVGSLPYDVNEEDLLSIFTKFGEILEFTILRDRNGRSKGCAALRFNTNEAADLCITTLHNKFCCGNVPTPLQVRYFEKRDTSPMTCFVEGLPFCFAPAMLWASFSATYGSVANVFPDLVNPFSMYVSFHKKSSALALLDDSRAAKVCIGDMMYPSVRVTMFKQHLPPMMPPYGLYGHYNYQTPAIQVPSQCPVIDTCTGADSMPSDPPMKLFVGCLPYSKTAQDIADLFTPFGALIEVAILTDYSGKSRGAAFVTFSRASDAKRAVNELKDFSFPKSTRCINISFAHKQALWSSCNRTSESCTATSCTSSASDDLPTPLNRGDETADVISA
jgi:hypothetical protein